MGERRFHKKKRDVIRRQKKPIMLITAEGKNKTEKQYFNSFREQHGKYVIRFVNTGSDTDPSGLLKAIQTAWEKNELSEKNGDKAYIVLDMDCDSERIRLVRKLQAGSKSIRFIVSNPCIEVWFIFHFVYSTHQFRDSREPKRELEKYIPRYEVSMDISGILRPRLKDAEMNIKQLKEYYKALEIEWGDSACNPMTDVPEVIKELGLVQ